MLNNTHHACSFFPIDMMWCIVVYSVILKKRLPIAASLETMPRIEIAVIPMVTLYYLIAPTINELLKNSDEKAKSHFQTSQA
jgi:hypothetical protein